MTRDSVARRGVRRLLRLSAAAILLLGACADGTTTSEDPCPSGTEGCACYGNQTCSGSLECVDGLCAPSSCETGAEGCACFGNGTCATGLECDGTTCQAVVCDEGTEGCACFGNGTCGAGLECESEVCVVPACDGQQGCACLAGDVCDVGLRCDGELCEECPVGTLGCGCDGGTCGADMQCTEDTCVTCPSGTLGCACLPSDLCGDHLGVELDCVSGRCEVPSCPRGKEGCLCKDDLKCDAGLQCSGTSATSTCEVPPECPEGTAGCDCPLIGDCNGGLYCDSGTCEILDCTVGQVGCKCAADGSCTGNGAVCNTEGWCEQAPCPKGTEGCPCAIGDNCGINTRGEQMLCNGEGQCEAASCAPGALGCVCGWGADCEAGATCSGGFCLADGCAPGAANCSCTTAGCGADLQCRDEAVCVDNTGYLKAPCLSDLTCLAGLVCGASVTCETCTKGVLGCGCKTGDVCNTGLTCWNGSCVDPTVTDLPPGDPKCYSRCESDFVSAAGVFVQCPADKLVDGCYGGTECVDGSCVLPGTQPKGCETELDCQQWQACIQGGCYSDCELDSECGDGEACVKRVCRKACEADGASCPKDYSCSTDDGQVGYCYRVQAPGSDSQNEVYADFEVIAERVELHNSATTTAITIQNNSPATETFVVRKRDHTTYMPDGTSEVLEDPYGDGVDCDPLQDCPLVWLSFGGAGTEAPVQSVELEIPGDGGQVTLNVLDADGGPAPRWTGRFEVVHDVFGVQTVTLNYSERPEGRWNGKVFYFATFGEDGLAEWSATASSKNNQALIDGVGNALVRQWAAFRKGDIDLENFKAVLQATRNESWRWSTVQADCPVPGGACYPYDINQLGLLTYTSNVESNPIPTGVVELPLSLNLRLDPLQTGLLTGKIDSDRSLQYAGDPAIVLDFDSDPVGCDLVTGGACLVFIDSLDAQIFVGGRYVSTASDASCADRPDGWYENRKTPWLLGDFVADTQIDPATGYSYRYECRDTFLPFNGGPASELTDSQVIGNVSLSLSNPIPDGRTRRRTLQLVDGALINQTQLFVLFKETYESFLPDPTATFSAYGYMLLERDQEELDQADEEPADGVPDVYQGNVPVDDRTEPPALLDVQCSPELIDAALDGESVVTSANAADLVEVLVTGRLPVDPCSGSEVCHDGQCCTQVCDSTECVYSACGGSCGDELIDAASSEKVHYVCHANGLFDGGPGAMTSTSVTIANDNSCGLGGANFYDDNGSCDDGGPNSDTSICPLGTDKADCGKRKAADGDFRVACEAGSDVTYFTVEGVTQAEIAAEPCQEDGSCLETLKQWKASSGVVQIDPLWKCEDATQVYCDNNRYDLRDGKVFYAMSDPAVVFPSLAGQIDLAFRYKTQFQNRDGSAPGFAPEVCIPDSNAIPYCYAPWTIEDIRDRVDCLLSIWRTYYTDVVSASSTGPIDVKKRLDDFLCSNFSYAEACVPSIADGVSVHDGFERLYSELLVMMGDESFTNAFASRFDLAGQTTVSFEGSLFEDNGINLSGPAGYEMYSLYKAGQYYQQVLDRFYGMSPLMWEALGFTTAARNFVTQETVTRYFERLIRASTQKARTWSEVAKRYQAFNEVELAKRVVQRAYTATYTENIVLSQLMLKIIDALAPEDRPQIVQVLEQGQRRYRMALLDMQNVYAQLGGEIRYFGLAPEYIPFPTVQGDTENAFEVILSRAKQKLELARFREDQAVERSKAFETDSASFQSELVNLRNNYENQLGDLCGTFEAEDGKVYPAITRYAEKSAGAAELGNPCGMVGYGAVHDALAQVDIQRIEMLRIRASYDKILEEVAIEKARVEAQCNLTLKLADYKYKVAGKVQDFQAGIFAAQSAMSAIDRSLGYASTVANLAKCSVGPGGTDCPAGAAALIGYTSAFAAGNVAALSLDVGVKVLQGEVAKIEQDAAKWETEVQCDAALIDSNARMASMLLSLKEVELEARRSEYTLRLRMSDIAELMNKAKRLEDEYQEAQQMAVNIQAARNDPNVRIYRQDAIVNAEVSFDDAIREAYKATRVLEYYTSQSYAALDQLFLIRMVQYGEYNLQNYLDDLEDAFNDFEDDFGLPSTRVELVSLRDDILAIPWTGPESEPLTQSDRINLMREALADPSRLDESGYLTIPFRTGLESLSPLTRTHKILFIEAEIIGSDVGDTIGRVYLRQTGTGTIHSVDDDQLYYRFPKRTAVLNPFFNGNRFFDQLVYRNYHLRDRPLVNTNWELVINQKDELANQDIDLQSLTDVRLFVYYQDFTEL